MKNLILIRKRTEPEVVCKVDGAVCRRIMRKNYRLSGARVEYSNGMVLVSSIGKHFVRKVKTD